MHVLTGLGTPFFLHLARRGCGRKLPLLNHLYANPTLEKPLAGSLMCLQEVLQLEST